MERIHLKDYMDLPLTDRQSHLDLSDSCVEIGAQSKQNRALLAMHLNTTCHALGKKTGYLCHACHNGECSNVKHLYWGTAKENSLDHRVNRPNHFKKIAAEKKQKYGEDYFKKLGARGKLGWKTHTPASKLSEHEVKRRLDLIAESSIDLSTWGWVAKVANLWGVSHTQVRRFFESYWEGPAPYRKQPSL
jgi:hypothetical protein